ncbi:aminotransferase class V-fold PLP-dependent enzyme [Rubripirellula amarantea]|nr:aminotransferase class V-fold PLP-dependent enzyme [Rubripirellula amarantea]
MPISRLWAYFDHAAVAPLSQPAAAAIEQFAAQASLQGDTVWPQWNRALQTLREQTATLLRCETSDICLVPNTTTGINIVAEGWPWQAGDSVVIPEGEFPSNLFPWLNQQSRGVEVRIVPRRDGRVVIDDLIANCDQSTRLIAVSWVGYATGFRLDIDDLVAKAHDQGIAVFLDAIQGLGMYDLDLTKTPVDFIAADGHKWLLGPEGAGVAMIRQEYVDRLRAGNVGWASVRQSHNYAHPEFALRGDASRFESGSANMIGMAALSASLSLFLSVRQAHGPDAIEQRVCALANKLSEKLLAAGAVCDRPGEPKSQSGIVNFQIPGTEPAQFREVALQHHVVVSCRGQGVRASIHAYNNEDDLDRLVEVVRLVNKPQQMP